MTDSVESLRAMHCVPLPPGTPPLDDARAAALLTRLPQWTARDGGIVRAFDFASYLETITFVNVVAWLSQQQDHHPDMHVAYKRCTVSYRTHSVGGLSENDFVCAARLDALFGS